MKNSTITVSTPGKIHLLGEHAVVYGKPALLAAINLRVSVTISPLVIARRESSTDAAIFHGTGRLLRSARNDLEKLTEVIEPIVKKYLKIQTIPPYDLEISSQLPIGCGLGSSAALSAAYTAALLTFLGIKWDKSTINDLAFEAEKAFHGNPSGADNSAVVFGGLVWFRKETPDLKIIQPLHFTIPSKLAKNFILINTGAPKETTKEMVEIVNSKFKSQKPVPSETEGSKFEKIFDDQEQLVKELLPALKEGNGKELIRIIREGEKNLESMGVVSKYVVSIIRIIESNGGAAKICGGGGKTEPTGVLLCYHPNPSIIQGIAKSHHLSYFKTVLAVEGLRQE